MTLGSPVIFKCGQSGFSLLELCVVMIVIGVLTSIGFKYYADAIEDSKAQLVRYQAASFSRTAQNLYGEGKLKHSHRIRLQTATVYLNELGWPASAGKRTSVRSNNQTAEECEALWHGMFKNAPGTQIAYVNKQGHEQGNEQNNGNSANRYRVSAINGRICRYELISSTNGRYFFDYYVTSGKVQVSNSIN